MNKRLFLCLLCCDRIALFFLHAEEEPADIHIQLHVQFIISVNINAFDDRIDDHLFCLDDALSYRSDHEMILSYLPFRAHSLRNMAPEHYIEWIAISTDQGNQRKILEPGDKPMACFALCDGENFEAAYAYCNLHGLWKK